MNISMRSAHSLVEFPMRLCVQLRGVPCPDMRRRTFFIFTSDVVLLKLELELELEVVCVVVDVQLQS